ncbi:hypothetical protein BDR22DRAFT_808348 [Usnea florida]
MASWEPSRIEIEQKPWKYLGYQSFSRFVASDNDLFILRRFGALSAQVILALQDELSCLEHDLEVIEKRQREEDAPDVHNGSFRQETQLDRRKLLLDARPLLRQYNDLVLQHSQLKTRPPVPKKDVSSLETWFNNKGNAILEAETEYIKHPSDLFSVAPKTKSPLRALLGNSSLRFGLFKKDESAAAYSDENVHYSSDEKIDHFIASFIMILGLIMLIAPLWILAFLGLVQRLGVISAFIGLFVALMYIATLAKPLEILGATAAYSAVLVVFLQISRV